LNTVKPSRLGLAVMPAMVVPCLCALLYFVAVRESLLITLFYTNTRSDLLAFQLYHLRHSPLVLLVYAACLTLMADQFKKT
jgi:hypothetical protein